MSKHQKMCHLHFILTGHTLFENKTFHGPFCQNNTVVSTGWVIISVVHELDS